MLLILSIDRLLIIDHTIIKLYMMLYVLEGLQPTALRAPFGRD